MTWIVSERRADAKIERAARWPCEFDSAISRSKVCVIGRSGRIEDASDIFTLLRTTFWGRGGSGDEMLEHCSKLSLFAVLPVGWTLPNCLMDTPIVGAFAGPLFAALWSLVGGSWSDSQLPSVGWLHSTDVLPRSAKLVSLLCKIDQVVSTLGLNFGRKALNTIMLHGLQMCRNCPDDFHLTANL